MGRAPLKMKKTKRETSGKYEGLEIRDGEKMMNDFFLLKLGKKSEYKRNRKDNIEGRTLKNV